MKLSIVGDMHYSSNFRGVEAYEETRELYFRQVFSEWFDMTCDFHVSIGDLTNMGTEEEFTEVLGLIQAYDYQQDFQLVIGNHDAYSLPKDAIQDCIQQPLYGKLYEDESYCILKIDTNRVMDKVDYSGTLSLEQLEWLAQEVPQHKGQTLIILAHHPVYRTTYWSDNILYAIDPKLPIQEILNQHQGQGIYVNGHTHADSIVEQGQWLYVQIANFYDQPYFRSIEIDSRQIKIEAIPLSKYYQQLGIWLGANTDYFALNKRGYQGEHHRNFTKILGA